MNPKRNRNRYYQPEPEKEKSAIVKFIELNTKSNLAIRDDHLYLDDVKKAININTLEQRSKTKLLIVKMLKKNNDLQAVIEKLEQSVELDKHRLIKMVSKD